MPNKANAKKALRQAAKRTVRNSLAKAELHSIRVAFRKAVTAKNVKGAEELSQKLGKMFDKAVARGIVKMNTAARTKSRMMANLNAIKKA